MSDEVGEDELLAAERALSTEERESAFLYLALKAFTARLALYEIPVDRVRAFLAGVEQDAMHGFGTTELDPTLDRLVVELLERLMRVKAYVVEQQGKTDGESAP